MIIGNGIIGFIVFFILFAVIYKSLMSRKGKDFDSDKPENLQDLNIDITTDTFKSALYGYVSKGDFEVVSSNDETDTITILRKGKVGIPATHPLLIPVYIQSNGNEPLISKIGAVPEVAGSMRESEVKEGLSSFISGLRLACSSIPETRVEKSMTDELEKLHQLKLAGALSENEYEEQKKKVLKAS